MLLWGQPVRQLVLKLNNDTKLTRALCYRVITEKQATEMTNEEIIKDIVKWRTMINKELRTKSIQLPKTKNSFGRDITSVAWVSDNYVVTFKVYSKKNIIKVDLTFHEPKDGLTQLGLENKTGSNKMVEEMPKPDSQPAQAEDPTTSVVDSGPYVESEKSMRESISLGGTRALQLKYSVKENFDADWPKLIKSDAPEITIIKENQEENVFIYQSPNYEFISDVQISKNIIKNFSTLFESTRLYCQEIPLSMVKAHMPEDTVKFKILLFESESSYYKNGGPPGSAGVYMPSSGFIMVPLSSLGVKKVGSRYMFDYKVSNKTLPHEITHQLTNTEYFNHGALGWFSEGLAEYIAATAYRSGKFMVNGNLNDIRSYVTEGSRKDGQGRYLGDELKAPKLKKFMLMSYGEFTLNGNFNYGLGALITYYFMHMEDDGDRKNINLFLTALNDGKLGEDALKVLLAGRTFEELEEDITKAWRTRGIKIEFK